MRYDSLTTATTTAGNTAGLEMVPDRMRGVATSLSALIVYLIGFGAGRTMVALATDYIIGDETKIGYALAAIPAVMLITASVLTTFCFKPYVRTLECRDLWIGGTGKR